MAAAVFGARVGGSGRTGARGVLGFGLGSASGWVERRGWRGVSGSWFGESRLVLVAAEPEGVVFTFDDGPLGNLSRRSSARDPASSGSRVRLRGEERIGVQASRGLVFVVGNEEEEELRLVALAMAWRRSSCRLLLSAASVAARIASPGGEERRVDGDGFVEEDEELRPRTLFITSFMRSDGRRFGRDEDDKDDDDDDEEGVAMVVFVFCDDGSIVDEVLSMASMSSFEMTTEDWRRGV